MSTKKRKAPTNVTHEPAIPVNWPDGHVKVSLTGDDADECILVWIHGHMHYLHSTTARELERMLHNKLEEWNKHTAIKV
jgi:hypothetical protein